LIGPHIHLIAKHEISRKRTSRLIPSALHKKILIQALGTLYNTKKLFNSVDCAINVHVKCKNIPFL